MREALRLCSPYFLFFIGLTYWVSGHPFFWDTLVQGSRYAHFFYDNDFSSMILPLEIDAGHPPFFGAYIALCWKIFGKSLFVSHFAILPFLLGIVWQLQRICAFFVEPQYRWLAMLALLTNTALLTQATLVSPDIVLVFCFLFALNGILYRRAWQIGLGLLGLGLISMRGLFLIGSLGLIAIGCQWVEEHSFRRIGTRLFPFAFILLIISTWYCHHYGATDWLLSTPNEAWSGQRGLASPLGILKNGVVLGWRIIDFGMLGWVLISSWLFYKNRKDGWMRSCNLPLGMPFMILICHLPIFLLFNNPVGHRYLIPLYLTLILAAIIWLIHEFSGKRLYVIAAILIGIQLSGNFWVYPQHIAKGWDATLAHLPYYSLREKVLAYLEKAEINPERVGTEFPNVGERRFIDLKEDAPAFAQKDLEKHDYIWYSNVFNDFSDKDIATLEGKWTKEKVFTRGQVYMILYKKN